MTLRLLPPERSLETLRALAASGAKGCVDFRKELIRRRTAQLAKELGK